MITLELAGWVLFVVSALCFTVTSATSGDPLALAGSLLFLVACFCFIVPIVRNRTMTPATNSKSPTTNGGNQ